MVLDTHLIALISHLRRMLTVIALDILVVRLGVEVILPIRLIPEAFSIVLEDRVIVAVADVVETK